MMLKIDEYIKFKNFEKKVKSPFTIFSDFESIKNILLAVKAINIYVRILS